MSQYDGSIRINTVIDSGNFTIQMRKIVAHIKDIEQEATGLRDRLKQIEDAKIPTKEYRDVQEQIEKTKNRLENLQEQKKEYLALGGSTDSDIFKNMSVEINELQKKFTLFGKRIARPCRYWKSVYIWRGFRRRSGANIRKAKRNFC